MAFLLVAVGGVLGANARYVVSQWAAARWGAAFPFGTLAINATGSLLLGLVLALDAARFGDAPDVKLLAATGFLGGYTTFSTFAFETVALGRQRDHWPAAANIAGSVALGLGGAALGVLLGGVGR